MGISDSITRFSISGKAGLLPSGSAHAFSEALESNGPRVTLALTDFVGNMVAFHVPLELTLGDCVALTFLPVVG